MEIHLGRGGVSENSIFQSNSRQGSELIILSFNVESGLMFSLWFGSVNILLFVGIIYPFFLRVAFLVCLNYTFCCGFVWLLLSSFRLGMTLVHLHFWCCLFLDMINNYFLLPAGITCILLLFDFSWLCIFCCWLGLGPVDF